MGLPMSRAESSEFARLMTRIRAGDDAAAREFWAEFGASVRRIARRWLSNSTLRRALDSADLQQSVAAEFFRLIQSGDVVPASASEVMALLRTITRHRFLKRVEYHGAERRDIRRLSRSPVEDVAVADRQPDPVTVVVQCETKKRFFSALSRLDSWIIDGRSAYPPLNLLPRKTRRRVLLEICFPPGELFLLPVMNWHIGGLGGKLVPQVFDEL
jgi:RNA polymerase sigma-70 factor (ECF subfamily)